MDNLWSHHRRPKLKEWLSHAQLFNHITKDWSHCGYFYCTFCQSGLTKSFISLQDLCHVKCTWSEWLVMWTLLTKYKWLLTVFPVLYFPMQWSLLIISSLDLFFCLDRHEEQLLHVLSGKVVLAIYIHHITVVSLSIQFVICHNKFGIGQWKKEARTGRCFQLGLLKFKVCSFCLEQFLESIIKISVFAPTWIIWSNTLMQYLPQC